MTTQLQLINIIIIIIIIKHSYQHKKNTLWSPAFVTVRSHGYVSTMLVPVTSIFKAEYSSIQHDGT